MGNQSNTKDNDWGWQDSPQKQMPSSKSYHSQLANSSGDGSRNTAISSSTNNYDDDWTGFDSYQDSSTSYQNTPLNANTNNTAATNKNLKLASTTQKLSEGFETLDVKNAKVKPAATKTAEDDAWNLLMN